MPYKHRVYRPIEKTLVKEIINFEHTSTCSRCCRKSIQTLVVRSFVFAGYLSDTLVTSCEEDDKHKGEEERDGSGDAPLAKDDAKVLG
jgi:hypothetical protein